MFNSRNIAEPEVKSRLCGLAAIVKFHKDKVARCYVCSMGRRTGFEHLLCYCGETGNELVRHSDRAPDRVGLPKRHLMQAKSRGGRLVIHHNHPQDMSLSLVDILHLVSRPGMMELFAHGHDGSWYWAESHRRRDGHDMVLHGANALVKAYRQLATRGSPLREELAPHLLNLALDYSGIIMYKFQLGQSMITSVASVSEDRKNWLLDCVKEAIRKERQIS